MPLQTVLRRLIAPIFAAILLILALPATPTQASGPLVLQMLSTVPDWSFESDQADALMGNWVAGAGDVNGDGFDEVLVSAPRFDNPEVDEGKVFLFMGSASGLELTPAWTYEPDQANAQTRSARSAGDVNGDGYGDVVIGVPLWDNDQVDEGRALLFLGSAAGLSATPSWSVEGDQAVAVLGGAVASAGDVNGDGFDDVHVSAVGYDNELTDEGRAYVFYGSASGLSLTPGFTAEGNQASSSFGRGMGAGDVNDDGYDDLVVGAQAFDGDQVNEGRVFVYMGSRRGLRDKPVRILEFNEEQGFFGSQVRGAGDVNADGFDDVIVGLINSPTPRVILFLGTMSGLSKMPSAILQADQPAQFGGDLDGAGDVNGDGFDDVIVGGRFYSVTPSPDGLEGRSFVFLGSASGLSTTAAWTFTGTQIREELGVSTGGAGDVNGDGFDDVIVGAHAFDNPESNEGRALVFHGSP